MDGTRRSIVGTDGVLLGLLTAGSGAPLLLVHGGFEQIERWAPVWELLVTSWRVAAMDRRAGVPAVHPDLVVHHIRRLLPD